jgi:SAM-dependent methyltransferase
LEVACGAGVGLGILRNEAQIVVGLDIDLRNCLVARSTYSVNDCVRICCADAQALPFGHQVFDGVVLFEAIYYLTDPAKFLQEAQRVLRADGVLIVSSVNCRWSGFNASPYSTKYYDAGQLVELLRMWGFDPRLFAGFPECRDGLVARAVHYLRVIGVRCHWIPKTMKGKEWLKRIFMGELRPIPRDAASLQREAVALVPVEAATVTENYRFLYAVARLKRPVEDIPVG